MRRSVQVFAVLLITLPGGRGWPCGPNFPPAYVWRDTGDLLLDMPGRNFYEELAFHFGGAPEAPAATPTVDAVEAEEIQTVLAGLPMEESRKVGLAQTYAKVRQITRSFCFLESAVPQGPFSDQGLEFYAPSSEPTGPQTFDFGVFRPLLTELPPEFSLYAEGAAHYHLGRYPEAVDAWDRLLALPPEERPHRSVWAAHMRGKCLVHSDPQKAIAAFEQVRQLVGEGFSDPFSFRTASLGWQALAEAACSDEVASIRHYVQQFQQGSTLERESSRLSLDFVCRRLFRESNSLEAATKDPVCRVVVSNWILSDRGYSPTVKRWAGILATLPPEDTEKYAGTLAHLFYRQGEMDAASQWVERALPEDVAARWVHSKLLLRAGKLNEAEVLLANLRSEIEEDHTKFAETVEAREPVDTALGLELASVRLNENDYGAALEEFLRVGSIADATYIADSIMTVEELEEFLKKHAAAVSPVAEKSESDWVLYEKRPAMDVVRYIFARKLARAGKFEEALNYLPVALGSYNYGEPGPEIPVREKFAAMADALKRGRDKKLNQKDRATALMEAARLTRNFGMEFFGTAQGPDWHLFGGVYLPWGESRADAKSATKKEVDRVRQNAPAPDRRYHYRWKASELMWEAASLLPDNDEQTARALWYGGSWIEESDPQGADKFYKALVRQCRALPIGQEADKLHWFPPKPEAWEEDSSDR